MTFELQIEFAGLCLFVIEPTANRTIVYMPDCRRGKLDPKHQDGDKGIPHVGYIRFDFDDQASSRSTSNASPTPPFEVVHQFDRESLDLGLTPAPRGAADPIKYPEVRDFANRLMLLPKLDEPKPPKELLTRLVLEGGTFSPEIDGSSWRLTKFLHDDPEEYRLEIANTLVWKRRIDSSHLTLTFTSFDRSETRSIRLEPRNVARGTPRIFLKIANLCCENPLEWPNLPERKIKSKTDRDFKWLYRLLQPKKGTWKQALKGHRLPCPLLVDSKGQNEGDLSDCSAMRFTLPDDAARDAR